MSSDGASSWNSIVEEHRTAVFSSSTARRVTFLRNLAGLLISQPEDIAEEELRLVLQSLLKTYNYYHDTDSRNALLQTLVLVVQKRGLVAQEVIEFIDGLARSSHMSALVDYMTLLLWTNEISIALGGTIVSKDSQEALIASQALLLGKCIEGIVSSNAVARKQHSMASSKYEYSNLEIFRGNEKKCHQKRAFDSAFASTVTSIVNTLRKSEGDTTLLDTYAGTVLSAKLEPHVSLAYLGALTVALAKLDPVCPIYFEYFVTHIKPQVLDFYVNKVLLARLSPSLGSLSLFGNFIQLAVTHYDVKEKIIPALEKASLRSSETAIGYYLPNLLTSLNNDIDISHDFTSSKLLASCFNGLMASSEITSKGAYESLRELIRNHCHKAEPECLMAIVSETLKLFKSVSNKDQKALIIKFLGLNGLAAVSSDIILELLPIIPKEQNETSLSSLVNVLIQNYFNILEGKLPLKKLEKSKIESLVIAGLLDKKLSLRAIWLSEIGDRIFTDISSLRNGEVIEFLSRLKDPFKRTSVETQGAPLQTLANKGILSSLVVISLCGLFKVSGLDMFNSSEENEIITKSLENNTDKPNILGESRIYLKLSNQSEQKWYLRALRYSFGFMPVTKSESILFYGKAWLYFAISSNVSHHVRLMCLEFASKAAALNVSLFSDLIIKALYDVLLTKSNDDSSMFNYHYKFLASVLSLLSKLGDGEMTKKTLKDLLVAANHQQVSVKNGWVGLCQRSNVDAGEITELYHDSMLDSISFFLSHDSAGGFLYSAALKSLGILSFIKPNLITPKIVDRLVSELDLGKLEGLDTEHIKIWRGKEGEPVIDVLQKTKKQSVDSNTKDYETRKWEEEMRKELAAKKVEKPQRLTKEEQLLVNEQVEKESNIRKEVQSIVDGYVRSIFIVNELVNCAIQIDNGTNYWFSLVSQKLLEFSNSDIVYEFIEDSPIKAFLHLSELISERLGNMKKFVGITTLRINNVKNLDPSFLEEPLQDLVARVLFRIKFLSDQKPLDGITLSYMIPLLTKVLEIGRKKAVENSKKPIVTSDFIEEDAEEQNLLLALEIIESHVELFEDESISRTRILKELISLMRLPSKAKVSKDCFLSLCRHISVNLSRSDLQILLDSIVTKDVFVRNALLEGLDSEFDLSGEMNYLNEIWIMIHSTDTLSSELAATICEENGFSIPSDASEQLLRFANNGDSGLRLSIAKSIASAVKTLVERGESDVFEKTIHQLIDLFHVKTKPPAPILDRFGLPIKSSKSQKDTWEERSTIAICLKNLAPFFNESMFERVFKFLVDEDALGDKEDIVRQELQEAGIELINRFGAIQVETLIPIFEACLSSSSHGSETQDRIRQNVVILYGTLARHLNKDDPRLDIIVNRMIKTLETPSEGVQSAISRCIAPLVPKFETKLDEYFDLLFETLFKGSSLAVRRGAAFGMSGLVRGSGIKSLSSYNIIRKLSEASDDKKDPKKREGVCLAFECLSWSLGKYFEPYVIEILPIILKLYGDQVPEVREATDAAARQIMKNTTSFGVKKLIPIAIDNLNEISWRSKKGSVELLGSMAYLDPTQLSSSLPKIVPEIVGVLNDSHKEVRKSADLALKRFGEVIRNPEIQAIVADLINAIGDPTKYTDIALDSLIKTQFVHYIDGPSLALINHVIIRGMRDRSAGTKKKACQIVGNMAILVDSRDLRPYLPSLVQELEVAMVDPVAGTRSTAARALGSLVEKLGEDQFPELIPRLLDTLCDETKTGDRLGSAQALAEVISGLGVVKLEEMLPTILSSATSPRSHIRAGFMPLLLYLPVCFGSQFAPYLNKIIPAILRGLADHDEDIRDTALRAGKLIVKNYAKKAVDLLLPELENGLSDVNYRIRLSSVQLTGDLLFQITGISGKNDISEDLSERSNEVNKSLLETLGEERRARILSALFLCRSDVAGLVRSVTVDVWKALVVNTPKTLKEILPHLTKIIVRRLASPDDDQRKNAAQTLGETVRRVGGNALPQLLPTLEQSFATSEDQAKQGICIALTELIHSSLVESIEEYQDVFIRTIKGALVDSAAEVREAAASAFESLQEVLGKVVIDEIIPQLLNMLESSDSESALLALRDIMSAKSDVIFPILIPTLLTPPIDSFKAKALASLSSVAGSALYRRLSLVINTLVDTIIEMQSNNEANADEVKSSLDRILLSIDDDEGVHPLMQQLLSLAKHEDSSKRAVIYERMAVFFDNTSLDYSVYVQDMISQFILSLGDHSQQVVNGTHAALLSLVKNQNKDSLTRLIKPAFQSLSITGVKGEELYAFGLPKGPNCILPIFLHGLMYGNSEQRELSALAIADIIDKTPSLNLRPFATSITGPLIRVVGEKVSSEIKSGILQALTNLLIKIPQFLRPFIPQLQRTFVRSLSDPLSESLRSRSVTVLGVLIQHQPRVDSLVAELVSGAKNTKDQNVKGSMLKAMLAVVNGGGQNMSESSKSSILSLVEEEITSVSGDPILSYARLLGSLAQILSTDEASNIIKNKILDKENSENVDDLKFSILSINSFLKDSPGHIFHAGLLDQIVEFVLKCLLSYNEYISVNAVVATGKLLLLHGEKKSPASSYKIENDTPFELDSEQIANLVNHLCIDMLQPNAKSSDIRRLTLVVVRTVARFKHDTIIKPHYDIVVPSVFSCLRDMVIPIKLAAEKAYLSLFNFVEDENMSEFNEWFSKQSTITTVVGNNIVPRSIGDYTKRVTSRLAGVERERIAAGGDAETLFSDRIEDEAEIWSIGGVDLAKE